MPSVASRKGSMAATAAWSSWAEGRGQSGQLGLAPIPLTALAGGCAAGEVGRSPGCLGGWKLWSSEIRAREGEG